MRLLDVMLASMTLVLLLSLLLAAVAAAQVPPLQALRLQRGARRCVAARLP